MKKITKIIIIGIILTIIIFGTSQSLMYQCGTLPIYLETPRNPNLWHCLEIWENQSKQPDINSELEFTPKLKNARDILYENQDIIPWTGLGVSTSEKAVTISIDDDNPEDYRKIIEELVGNDIPVIIKKGGDPFINSENIPDQLESVFVNCNCQERMRVNPDTSERCTQPHLVWENSTHYIDNIFCEWKNHPLKVQVCRGEYDPKWCGEDANP